MLSAIVIIRKATIRTNAMPRSSIMIYKDLDLVITTISILLRVIEN